MNLKPGYLVGYRDGTHFITGRIAKIWQNSAFLTTEYKALAIVPLSQLLPPF